MSVEAWEAHKEARETRAKYEKLVWSLFTWGMGIITGYIVGHFG